MIINLLLFACSDNMIAYPVEKESEGNIIEDTATYDVVETTPDAQQEDEHVEEVQEPIDEEPIEDTGYEDTGSYEEEIIEEEPEEIIEEEIEEIIEEVIEEEPVSIVDNYNYSNDFAASGGPHWGRLSYAASYGWSQIDAYYYTSEGYHLICGLNNGYIDCECENANGVSNYCGANGGGSINQYIPFQQFVDIAVGYEWICGINTIGGIECFENNGAIFAPPDTGNDYIDVVVAGNNVCGLDSAGLLFCFDLDSGGLTYNDSSTYKSIEGHGWEFCGVYSDGLGYTCVATNNMTMTVVNSHTTASEIIGFDSYEGRYCYVLEDVNGMQMTTCGWSESYTYTGFQLCLTSSPHQYYYDFFTNNTDLSNIEVAYDWGAVWDSNTQTEIRWGGYFDVNGGYYDNSKIVGSSYYTGGGCNYYWGN